MFVLCVVCCCVMLCIVLKSIFEEKNSNLGILCQHLFNVCREGGRGPLGVCRILVTENTVVIGFFFLL